MCLARLAVAGLLLLISHPLFAAQTIGPVTDDLGVIKIPKGAPITIGGYWVISGADTAMGLNSKRGAELAFKNIGDKLLGHPIKFTVEDDLCSAEGGQPRRPSWRRPADVHRAGRCVLQRRHAGRADPWQQGIPNICTACSAPSLTAPDRGAQYDGFGRTIASDIDQGASDAKYMTTVMKAKTIVAIHDGSPYAQQLAAVAAKNFTATGGKVLSTEAVAPTDVDMHPVLTKIAAEKPDVIYMPIFVAAAAQLLRQSKEIPGLEHTAIPAAAHWRRRSSSRPPVPVVGFHIAYPDVSIDTMGKGYPAFVAEYKKVYGEAPISGYHANAYDAAEMAIKAIQKVAKLEQG